ncbi:MAG: exo-alpha-sialidase [Clostridia bacterium]|nr:exo-alpha-sialidase [Clostridia bacterium]
MKRIETLREITVFQNAFSPFFYFGWPSITRLPGGALACVASGFRLLHVCPFGKSVISYSFDDGKTFTPPAVALDTPLDDRDSGLVPFAGGRVILTSFNNTAHFQKITNEKRKDAEGADKARYQLIDAYIEYVKALGNEDDYIGSLYRISDDGGFTFGPIHKSPVTCPHGPMCLPDGSLLYVGRRFSPINQFDDGKEAYIECWKLNEKDELEYVSSIENVWDEYGILNSCEPHAICLPDGRILVHIRVQRSGEHGEFTLYQSESSDGGKTFTKPVPILPHLGGSPAHLFLHSSGVLISAYGYREKPYGIRILLSKDLGKTWEDPYTLYDGGQSGDLGYPATAELADGSLLTVYYENTSGQSRIIGRVWKIPE